MHRFSIWPGLRWVCAALRNAAQTGLYECGACGSDMVIAVDRLQLDDASWTFRLRCGACGVAREAEASKAQAADFDGAVAWHRRTMERELARLERRHMAEDVDCFAEALRRDLIDATDFEPRRPGRAASA